LSHIIFILVRVSHIVLKIGVSIYYFDKGKSYEVEDAYAGSRFYRYFMINGCQFSVDKLTDYDQVYVYNFFYTEREYRKLKLDKLNKI